MDLSKDTANKLIGKKAVKIGLVCIGVIVVGGGAYHTVRMKNLTKSLMKRFTQHLIATQKGGLTEKRCRQASKPFK